MACTPTVSSPLITVWLTVILHRQIFSTARLDWSNVTEQRKEAVQPLSHRHNSTWLDSVSMSKAVCRHVVIQLNRYAAVVTGNFICSVSVFSWYHFFMAQQLEVQDFLIFEATKSDSDTPHSTGLLWESDQPDADIYIRQNTICTRDRHPCPRRDSKLQSYQASGRRPTP